MKGLLLILIQLSFFFQTFGKEDLSFTSLYQQNSTIQSPNQSKLNEHFQIVSSERINHELPKKVLGILLENTVIEFETVSIQKQFISTLYFSSRLCGIDFYFFFKESKKEPTLHHHFSIASRNSRQILFHNFRI